MALTAAAAFAVPAGAASPPSGNHILLSFPQRDFISGEGYSPSEGPVVFTVVRNGVTIATSTAVTPQDDGDPTTPFTGIVEVNHPGGGCWVDSTPDILPGDEIVATTQNGTGQSEGTTTANVTASPAELDAAGNVVVHGTAQGTSGAPLPIGDIEQRLVANKDQFNANGRRTLRAGDPAQDGTLSYDPVDPATNPAGVNWTATYTGLDAPDKTRAVGAETRILWLGPAAAGNEGTIFETAADGSVVGGPATPDCTAPFAQSAIGATRIAGVPTKLINQSNVGNQLVVSGPYDPKNVDGAGITVTVGGIAATLTTNADTWTATLSAAALPEGKLSIRATFPASVGGSGAPDSVTTILKDTIAPGAPTANLAGGTYPGPQTITLQADPGATIRFTGDGSTPTATSGVLFGAPLSVTASQTIKAVAVDDHGNASALSTFVYTIGAGAVLAPRAPGVGPLQEVKGSAASALSVSRLALARRISITRLSVQGLRVSMRLQDGTKVVRIAIYRALNGKKSGRALFVSNRVPRSAGVYRVRLRDRSLVRKLKVGRYVIEARAGQSRALLGGVSRRLFQIVR